MWVQAGSDLRRGIIDELEKADVIDASADATFGLMKNVADKGKGYDGISGLA